MRLLTDAGIGFTLVARSAMEAKISAVADSLQSFHCSRNCAKFMKEYEKTNHKDSVWQIDQDEIFIKTFHQGVKNIVFMRPDKSHT